MESSITKDITVTLVLGEREAKWLRGLVQNSPYPPQDEPSENKEMRMRFWNALEGIRP